MSADGDFEMTDQPQLMTPGQVAHQLNVSLTTLWRWRQEDRGPAYIRLGDTKHSPVRYLPLQVMNAMDAK